MWRPDKHAFLCEPQTSSSPLTSGRLFKNQTRSQNKQNNLYRSPDPDRKEPYAGIASDSCFLLCNYTQLLFLREGILVL